jgi:hypothetical protein
MAMATAVATQRLWPREWQWQAKPAWPVATRSVIINETERRSATIRNTIPFRKAVREGVPQ